MTTLNGNSVDLITPVVYTTETRGVVYQGVQVAPPIVVIYFMAAFDNLGNRYYWKNTDASMTGAPSPIGTYVSSTLIIEGRILS